MTPENNTNNPSEQSAPNPTSSTVENSSTSPDVSIASEVQPTAAQQVVSSMSAPSNLVETTPIPPTTPSQPETSTPQVASSSPNASKPKNPMLKAIAMGLLAVIIVVAAISVGYSFGKKHSSKPVTQAAATSQPINLPPEAKVTSECTPGRGKQYIIPKDIPAGPIYDVENSKVIAIEYVIGIHQLLSNSDNFSTTILAATKNYPVDHLAVVPGQPKPGDTDQYIHLIMYVVPKSVANAITCSSPTTTTNSTSQSN